MFPCATATVANRRSSPHAELPTSASPQTTRHTLRFQITVRSLNTGCINGRPNNAAFSKTSRCHLSPGRRETARMPRSPWTCSQPVSVGGLAGLRECGNAIHRKQVPFRSSRHQAPLALNTELSMSRHNAPRFSRGPHCSLKQMLTRRLQTLVSHSSLEELRVLFTDRVSPGSLTTREPTPIVV